MKIKELREKNEKELNELLASWREKLRDLKFKVVAEQHKNVRELRKTKKDIAQALTILKERELTSGQNKK